MVERSDTPVAAGWTPPRPWEQEASFHDVLYDWMSRTPWLALSAAAHAIAFFVLLAIPWDLLAGEEGGVIVVQIAPDLEEVIEDPVEPEPEIEEPELPIEEPQLRDALIPEDETRDSVEEPVSGPVDHDFLNEAPFDELAFNDIIGIGGGAGRAGGGPLGRRRRGGGDLKVAATIRAGLDWLARHQDADGRWDCDGFMKHDPPDARCEGAGEATHDVGMTALALLAFLGQGSTSKEGEYRHNVARGIAWLKQQQDPDTGLLGEAIGQGYVYDHALATLALCEAYYFTRSPLIRRTAQDAVNWISRARNPYGAWRYEVPPDGESDTSVTGWMVFALKSAEEAGLVVDPMALTGALSWLEEVTDPATGRAGYVEVGGPSSRIARVNDHFPVEKGEALTAVALLCRIFLGQDPQEHEIMRKSADLLRRKLPEWDPEGLGCDMYYWYYGSYAMYQMGGSRWWAPWNKAMKGAVLDSQREDGSFRGSWDPAGPWGVSGGRVYSTALMVLCLEVYFRYARVLGGR